MTGTGRTLGGYAWRGEGIVRMRHPKPSRRCSASRARPARSISANSRACSNRRPRPSASTSPGATGARRPDPVNALLSFAYALLTRTLTVTLGAVGFDR